MATTPRPLADYFTELRDPRVRLKCEHDFLAIQPGATQFGVTHGDIRALAKKIGPGRALAMSLWETRNVDAQLLAVLLVKPSDLSADDVDRLVRSITFGWVADWLINYVIKPHADKETLRQRWPTTTLGPPAPAGN